MTEESFSERQRWLILGLSVILIFALQEQCAGRGRKGPIPERGSSSAKAMIVATLTVGGKGTVPSDTSAHWPIRRTFCHSNL